MSKKLLISSMLLSGVMISCNVGASVVSPDNLSNPGNKVKLIKENYSHRHKQKTEVAEKGSSTEKFFKKLEDQEESKKTYSRLPIYAKYRTQKHDYSDLCAKSGHHILINKKRARAACKDQYS